MNFLARMQESWIFGAALILAVVLSAAQWMPYEYLDHDVIIYTLVGRGIFQHGEMPYHFAFDHKPVLTYFFYGPLAWLDGWGINRYALLTLVFLCLTSYAVYRLAARRRVPYVVILVLFAGSTLHNIGYSGNTEVIFVFFEILSVLILLSSNDRSLPFALSAIFAAISFNINYISAIPLVPALLYSLFAISDNFWNFIRRAISFGLIASAFIALIFGTMTLLGGDVPSYLDLQRRFISGYTDSNLPISKPFLFIWAAMLVAAAITAIPAMRLPRPEFDKWLAMVLLIIFSSLAIIINAKFYTHYLFMVTAPTVAMILCLDFERATNKSLIVIVSIFASCLLVFNSILNLSDRSHYPPDMHSFYRDLRAEVHLEKVMSIKTSVTPLYFSGAIPFQPLVWFDHAKFIYGKGEDDYYLASLGRKPQFVLTDFELCSAHTENAAICQVLADRYELIQSRTPPANAYFPGYDLFGLKPFLARTDEESAGAQDPASPVRTSR